MTQEKHTIIVDAENPYDDKVQEVLKYYGEAITATGIFVIHNDEERIAVELCITGNIEEIKQKIREEGLTILEDAINISKISSF